MVQNGIPKWIKTLLIILGVIATYLFLATGYDYIQGDMTPSRWATIWWSLGILIPAWSILGWKKIVDMFEKGIGMK